MKYVDLFSGCGGLSLGIEKAGGRLIAAVEKSDMAARTFFHNFIDDASKLVEWEDYLRKDLTEQYKHGLVVKELQAVLDEPDVMAGICDEGVDVVVGGPPCQGFSLAGRRNPLDQRNRLPWQYLEFVEYTAPKAVVIENVVGMNQRFAEQEESSFAQLMEALRETGPGYTVQGVEVNAKHYGAPQHRPRLMIIGLRNDIADAKRIRPTGHIWKSDFRDKLLGAPPVLAPMPTISSHEQRTVRHAISDLAFNGSDGAAATAYQQEMLSPHWPVRPSLPAAPLNHTERRHTERVRLRFRVYQFLAANKIDQRLLSRIASLPPGEARALATHELAEATIPASSTDGTLLANSLQDLVELVLTLGTRKHSQKVLAWDQPARTVVTLPDDYVHPEEPRIFTVRELARFQGFPDSFEFLGKETTGSHRRRIEVPQYSQVGNAVSPWLSTAVGKMLVDLVKE